MRTGNSISPQPHAQLLEVEREPLAHLIFSGAKPVARPPASRTGSISRRHAPVTGVGQVDEPHNREALFVRWVLCRAGLRPEHYRLPPLLRRIPACLRALRVESSAQARALLVDHPEVLSRVLNALLIGTTEFFRDAAVFEMLERRIVPRLLERTARPRVWSVACSEGAELYSVAMLLARSGSLGRGRLLGTDCRAEAIDRARRGVIPPMLLGGIPATQRKAWVTRDEGQDVIRRELRDMIHWQVADVLESPAEAGWDLILCRNLAIYLGATAAAKLWQRLAGALVPGGVLVVGKAERPYFPGLVREAPSIYRKQPELRPAAR